MGYMGKWVPSSFEKQMHVDTMAYRIHFALICGAKSCPPIAFYCPAQLNKQPDLATMPTCLELLNMIMGWFGGDFGGKINMPMLISSLSIIAVIY